ncbi:MAG: excinuclease ABC subunit UvrA [Candidatus Aminicenantes bacterium]|nr:excinuclease ABC subunit UvrA [Candidatus Aminicenantes bacterium]
MSYLEIVDAHKHNLKHLHLRIPKQKLIVISGVSGSGKSTLAYDTIFQEGQRKYLESLSAYARQFIKSLERPDVHSIRGIAPTIAIDQKHSSYYFNSTVGTISEIAPFLRLLFARLAEARCPQCGRPISRYSSARIAEYVFAHFLGRLLRIFSPLVRNRRGNYQALFEKYRKRGFLKALVNGRLCDLEHAPALDRQSRHHIAVQIDVLEIEPANRERIVDSINLALNEGDGEIVVAAGDESVFLSNRLHCSSCDISLPEPQPGTFSFNSPEGACPECQGMGREDEARPCAACQGSGLNPGARSFYFRGKNIFELGEMEIVDLLRFFKCVAVAEHEKGIARPILPHIIQRLESFVTLNLGYIALNRKLHTISGGELQRARLVSQLGFSLNGVIYVLDEPSIGMHFSEQLNLLRILRRLRENGNTLIVVEHAEETIRAADYIIDIGPGAGEKGGELMFAGPESEFAAARQSLTSDYVFGRRCIEAPVREGKTAAEFMRIDSIAINNLRHIDLKIPLNRLTVVSGVSGSGKSSLVVDALAPILLHEIQGQPLADSRLSYARAANFDRLKRVLMVNQSAIGKNSRSCPATYIGIMAAIRDLFAALPGAKVKGYPQSRFSFNVRGGRCEACQGLGVQKLQMSFLPQLEIACPVCDGRRYNSETCQVKFKGKSIADVLELTASEAYELFANIPHLARNIRILLDVGLGYLRLGQSSETLSGGESQRIKLTKELSHSALSPTMYVLDEPTVGLHFDDVRKLIDVFRALIARAHTVVVIEHNLEMIKVADYLVDLGPGGGKHGGRIVYQGDVAGIAKCAASLTGKYLKKKLAYGKRQMETGMK